MRAESRGHKPLVGSTTDPFLDGEVSYVICAVRILATTANKKLDDCGAHLAYWRLRGLDCPKLARDWRPGCA